MEIRSTEQGKQVTLSVKGEIEVYSLPEFSRLADQVGGYVERGLAARPAGDAGGPATR